MADISKMQVPIAGTVKEFDLKDASARSGLASKTNETNIAYVESTTTASRSYAIGDFLIYNGQLYIVEKAIAIEGTIITSGVNQNVYPSKVSFNFPKTKSVSNWNDAVQSGLYYSAGDATNVPTTSNRYYYGQVIRRTVDQNNYEIVQMVQSDVDAVTPSCFTRTISCEGGDITIGSWLRANENYFSTKYIKKETGIAETQEIDTKLQNAKDFIVSRSNMAVTFNMAGMVDSGTTTTRGFGIISNNGRKIKFGINGDVSATNDSDTAIPLMIIPESSGKTKSNADGQVIVRGVFDIQDAKEIAKNIESDGTNDININTVGNVNIGTQYNSAESENTGGNLTVAGIVTVNGSDYAEKFEESEPCPVNRFVTLDGERIRLAQSDDDYILGVTSEKPAIVGDKDNDGVAVGLIGKLWVEHDGSAKVNDWVCCGKDGIAVGVDYAKEYIARYRVMAVNGNRCKILVK